MLPSGCKAVRMFCLYLLTFKTFVHPSQQIFYKTFSKLDSGSGLAYITYDPIHNIYPVIHLPSSCPFIPVESCKKDALYWKNFEDYCNLSSYCPNGTHAQCAENKEYLWKNVLLVCAPIGNCDRDARNIVYYDKSKPSFYKLGKKRCGDGQYHSNQNFCFGDCVTDSTILIHQRSSPTAPATVYCNYQKGYCNADKPMTFEWKGEPGCYLSYDKGHRSCPSGAERMPDCSCVAYCKDGYVRDPSKNFTCKMSPELLLYSGHIQIEQKVDVQQHHTTGLRLVWRFSFGIVSAIETLKVTYWQEGQTKEKVVLGTVSNSNHPEYTDIEDLLPGQTYVFEIQIFYKQDGSLTNVTIHKSETTRLNPVENITSVCNPGNIELMWVAPTNSKQDHYRVEYRMVRRNRKPSWSHNTTHDCKFTLHRPFPGEEYELSVFAISNGTASEERATSLVVPPLSPERLHHNFLLLTSGSIVDVYWHKNDSRSHVEKWQVRYNKSNGEQSQIDVPLPDKGNRVHATVADLRPGQSLDIFVYSLVGDITSLVPANIKITVPTKDHIQPVKEEIHIDLKYWILIGLVVLIAIGVGFLVILFACKRVPVVQEIRRYLNIGRFVANIDNNNGDVNVHLTGGIDTLDNSGVDNSESSSESCS